MAGWVVGWVVRAYRSRWPCPDERAAHRVDFVRSGLGLLECRAQRPMELRESSLQQSVSMNQLLAGIEPVAAPVGDGLEELLSDCSVFPYEEQGHLA